MGFLNLLLVCVLALTVVNAEEEFITKLTKAAFSDILNEFKAINSPEEAGRALDKFLFGGDPEPVGFSEIASWRPLGNDRHVLGLGKNGQPLAIYDLSIPNPLSPKQVGRMALGVVGIGGLNLRELLRMIKEASRNKEDDSMDNEVGQMDSIGSKHGDQTSEISPGWTNNVSFTQQGRKRAMLELQEGKLSFKNLDFAKMIKGDRFQKTMNTTRVYLKRIFGLDFGSNLFDNFFLVPTNDSTQAKPKYSIHFNSIFSEENIEFGMVADLRRADTIRANVLALYLIKKLTVSVVGLLDYVAYPLGAICKFAVNNFFKFMQEQKMLGMQMLWEHLSNAILNEDKVYPSPLAGLSNAHREHLKLYFMRRTGSWWFQLFPSILRPNAKDWDKRFKDENTMTVKSHQWMTNAGWTRETVLSKWYAIYKKGTDKVLATNSRGFYKFSMQDKIGTYNPHYAIDYTYPHKERAIRIGYSIYDAIISFIPGPTWPLDEVLNALVNYFIMSPDSQRKGYENRLAQHLLLRQFQDRTQNWEYELGIIYAARNNPFMLDRKEEVDLLSLRWPIYGNCSFARCRKLQVGCSWDESTKDCCDVKCSDKRSLPTDCVWNEWQAWSPCSAKCGPLGLRSAIRTIKAEPTFGGKECFQRDSFKEEQCSGPPCPVDCVWNGWSTWSTCSAECGEGKSSSTRTVAVKESLGGAKCEGESTRTRDCYNRACPGAYIAGITIQKVLNNHIPQISDIMKQKHEGFKSIAISGEEKTGNGIVYILEVWLDSSTKEQVSNFTKNFHKFLSDFLLIGEENLKISLLWDILENEDVSSWKPRKRDFGIPQVNHLGFQVVVVSPLPGTEITTTGVEPVGNTTEVSDSDDFWGLSVGEIVGISLGSFIAFLLVIILVVLLVTRVGGNGEENYKSFY